MKVCLLRDFFVEAVLGEVDSGAVGVMEAGVEDARDERALKSALSSSRAVAVVEEAWESADFRALL